MLRFLIFVYHPKKGKLNEKKNMFRSQAINAFIGSFFMRIGIISDTHTSYDSIDSAVELLAYAHNADTILHLGDDSTDADRIKDFKLKIIAVPGIYEARYRDYNFPNRRIEIFDGWKFLLTHTRTSHEYDLPQDIAPEKAICEKLVDSILFGHTHIPLVEDNNGVLFINPGHLKPDDKRGYPPSYALLETSKESLKISIFTLIETNLIKEYIKRKPS